MFLERITPARFEQELERITPHPIGQAIMAKKAQLLAFKIEALPLSAALTLKQEALRVGAELATPKDCILAKKTHYTCLLVGTLDQLERLRAKCTTQAFGLKRLAHMLEPHLQAKYPKNPALMGVINLTPDSFYPHSRYSPQKALDRIYACLEQQIPYIDIGAASSRPFSARIDPQEEIARLKEVCFEIKAQNLNQHAIFSIDTYNAKSADFALGHGFTLLNDVNGFRDDAMCAVAKAYQVPVILMHAQGVPMDMDHFAPYTCLFAEMDAFFETQLERLHAHGITEIILDVGIGFNKTTAHNLALIQHLAHFLHFGYPLLVGASRKKCVGEVCNREVEERLAGTLALHLIALQNGASLLRVHDIAPHIDMLKITHALQKS
ncbi:dihydropteroate synthase [Helicobacter baculiformis]|uniref:dihydropteroate synthase n=1 Tax=Helicobacter baculiformis TaxID=427351 RepID=A0A1M4NGW1_9HELI|nr:dihydropteroate synthase [Helicobacter baculiformis]SFZ71494.1 OMP679 [Helicobacter baculiformis]